MTAPAAAGRAILCFGYIFSRSYVDSCGDSDARYIGTSFRIIGKAKRNCFKRPDMSGSLFELSGRQNEIVLSVPTLREAFSNSREGFSIYRDVNPGLLMEIEQFHLEAECCAWRNNRRLAAIAICDGGRADDLCLFTLVHLL